jgi:hypothetical protein
MSRRRLRPEPAEGFAEFYAAYPRRQGRVDAERAWNALRPSPELRAEILEAVERHKRSDWRGKERQYIPLPATFLNGRRWEDELGASLPAAPNSGERGGYRDREFWECRECGDVHEGAPGVCPRALAEEGR